MNDHKCDCSRDDCRGKADSFFNISEDSVFEYMLQLLVPKSVDKFLEGQFPGVHFNEFDAINEFR